MKAKTSKRVSKKAGIKLAVRSTPLKPTRFALVLLPVGIVALALSFSLSLVPDSVSAASLYVQCHNHDDDNDNHVIDLMDPSCNGVANTAPVALDQTLITAQGVATSTTLTANDADDDLLYFATTSNPLHGVLSGTLPDISYTPNAGFSGSDSFDFSVHDGRLADLDSGTITITITAAVPLPVVCGANEITVENSCVPCSENQHVSENACVNNAPVVPTCTATQHLENNVCVENPAPPASNGGGGGGGGGGGVISGPLSIGFINTNNTNGSGGGVVLGTSTEDLPAGCSAYLTGGYLRMGSNNNSEDVKKLQKFLNKQLGLDLPITGIFGPMTDQAVRDFQVMHWEPVLKPWVAFGLPTDHTPTGYVYKTTKRWINLLQCQSLVIPLPELP